MWIETFCFHVYNYFDYVTPHVGVWIETSQTSFLTRKPNVTPHVGVWIETAWHHCISRACVSHLM